MKLNKLFLLAAMGLGLFACNNNDLVEGSAPNGTQEEGTTYVGFSIDFENMGTRATEEGVAPDEQTITSAYVVMTNNDGIIEAVAKTSKAGTSSNAGKQCYVFQTTPGLHYFYAVANPDEQAETQLTVGGDIDNYFNTATTLDVPTITSANNFMMSSVERYPADVKDNITEAEALAGTANSFSLKIERVVAKVTMTCDNETLANSSNEAGGGTIKNTTFTLKNGASMSYRMAQDQIKEISDTYDKNSDPTLVYIKETDPSEEVGYIYRSADPVYCLENLHTTYYQKNTTYVDIETTFTPAKVVKCLDQLAETPDDNLNDNSTTGSFFVVGSGEHAQNYLMKTDLLTWQKGKGYVSGNEISKDPAHFPAGVESISDEYTDGKCFFGPIWIGQETDDAPDAPVTRNTWYNLKITGIKLPGDTHAPEIDKTEETPLVPPTNVAIILTVMPWNFIDRGITLQ